MRHRVSTETFLVLAMFALLAMQYLTGVKGAIVAIDGTIAFLAVRAATTARGRDERVMVTVSALVVIWAGLECLNPNVLSLFDGLRALRKTWFQLLGFLAGLWCARRGARFDGLHRATLIGSLLMLPLVVRQAGPGYTSRDLSWIASNEASAATYQLGVQRAFGYLSGPFQLGMLGVFLLVAGLWLFLFPEPTNHRRRFTPALSAAVGIVFIVGSRTRSSLVASVVIAAALLGFAFLQERGAVRKTRLLRFVVGMAALGSVFGWFVQRLVADPPVGLLASLLNAGSDPRLLTRLDLARLFLDRLGEQWLLGHGIGSADPTGSVLVGVGFPAHNLVQSTYFELGLVGLVLVGLWFLAVLRQSKLLTSSHRALVLALLGVLVVPGLSGNAIDSYPANILVYLSLGLVLGSGRPGGVPALMQMARRGSSIGHVTRRV